LFFLELSSIEFSVQPRHQPAGASGPRPRPSNELPTSIVEPKNKYTDSRLQHKMLQDETIAQDIYGGKLKITTVSGFTSNPMCSYTYVCFQCSNLFCNVVFIFVLLLFCCCVGGHREEKIKKKKLEKIETLEIEHFNSKIWLHFS
jgi:hypothetical protein